MSNRERLMMAVVLAVETWIDTPAGEEGTMNRYGAVVAALREWQRLRDALPAQPQPQGETVEVAVNMWRNAASGEWCPVMVEDDDDDPERDRAWQHVGTLTARIPLPVAPTISATVTREGGE